MKKSLLVCLALAGCHFLISQPNFSLQNFATGFNRLVDLTHCGDERLFVVERDGRIRIVRPDGTVEQTPFLDIDARVNSNQSEQGLLGLAFHPNYLTNGFFYVYYTDSGEDTQVSRFSVMANDPDRADPDSEFKILDTAQPFWNHNGGCIKFGPDGYLYISIGDGGSGGDPQANGQKRTTFLGKMLRIDVDNGSPYSVPTDNPFISDSQTLDEIWSLGLRNAWRFSFDRVTGDMWIGDVGQNAWEEIDFQPANSPGGENYGWRCHEGDHVFNTNNCAAASTMTFPVFEYPNSFTDGCSVTGGFVYRGCEMPALYGRYIFADYCSGKFWAITPDGAEWVTVEVANLTNNNFSSFGENLAGELFVVGHGNGTVSKVVSTSGILAAQNEKCEGDANGAIAFTIPTDHLTDPVWNDGATELNRTNVSPGVYSVEVKTTNGCVFTQEITVQPGAPYPDQPLVEVGAGEVLSTTAPASSYQWLLNGTPIPGATGPNYTALVTGVYSLIVSNPSGCQTASADISVTVTKTLEQLGLESVTLTPNPFQNQLRLQVRAHQTMELEINLTDASGKSLLQERQTVKGVLEKNYQWQHLAPGVYFISLKNEKGEWGSQVVKN